MKAVLEAMVRWVKEARAFAAAYNKVMAEIETEAD